MANAIQQAGGASEPSSFAPLHTNRIFTGLWTNRSPLSDAAISSDMEKYGLGRQDSILDGKNTELSSKLTLIRRPGTSVYNSQIFPPINRFFSFNTFTLTDEFVRVMADTAATVYDATGPNTKNAIWQKSPGAGPTFFLAVGNTLYFTNGVDNKQWTVPPNWKPNTRYYMGDTVLDSNGYVQEVVGFQWDAMTSVAVASGVGGNQATIVTANPFGGLGQPMQIVASSIPGLNYTPFTGSWSSATNIFWNGVPSSVPLMGPTNVGGFLVSVTSSGGVSGASAPAWQGNGGVTGDNGNAIIWHNQGPNVVDWGIAAPLNPPTITQSAVTNPFLAWLPNTAVGGFWRGAIIIYDAASNTLWTCSVYGHTGAGIPTFTGSSVSDGGTAWRNTGTANWQANHNYAFSDCVSANVSTSSGAQPMVYTVYSEGTTGNSGATAPVWLSGVGSLTVDGSVTWINVGNRHTWDDIGPNTLCWPGTPNVANANYFTILDPNGYTQIVGQSGKTGSSPPQFNTSLGGQTATDGSVIWINSGAFAVASTAPAQYGYAYKNSVTGDISGMSPASAPILLQADSQVTVQGQGSTDSQVDTIVIYRTEQGGSTFFYLAEIPNPAGGAGWTYTDTTPDSGLTLQIQAQVNGEGTPLPRGATCMAYHLQRIFVAVGNVVYVSSGPDAIASTSSGNAGFNTTFTAQSRITRFWVSPLGLVVFTVRDSYIILGSATSDDPLYMVTFIDRLPLLHYDAFTTHLTTPYMMLGFKMVVALDPSAGITEISFPIADRIEAEMNPSTAYVTYHAEASREAALYVADGATEWYRMSATTAPETGLNWSPRAVLEAPTSAVQSVEVLPGVDRLLIGPGVAAGPILQRDLTKFTDNENPYPAYTTFGSIVLVHPGELAALAFFTLESKKIGTKPALSVLLGEVSGTFEPLNRTRQDPTNLPPSNTLYSDRYHFLQSQSPAWCRHFQMTVTWPEEDAANELYTFTIFGQTWQEYRSQ